MPNALQITDPNADNPLVQAPSWADAYGSVTGSTQNPISDLDRWLAAQRAKSAKMGLWDDRTGLPTGKGLVSAAQQAGNALLMGTTAPGARATMDNPAFAKWFGGSKVVDQEGKPLVVYHGSGADIPQFDTGRGAQTTGNVTAPWGSYFTPSPGEASRYAEQFHGSGQNVTPVHLAIENPYEMTRAEWDKHAMTVFRGQMTQEEAMAAANDFKAKLQEAGHDGIVIKGRGFNNEYVAFSPEQIKSAIGNRGTYDPHDPRIIYGAAGLLAGTAATNGSQQPPMAQ